MYTLIIFMHNRYKSDVPIFNIVLRIQIRIIRIKIMFFIQTQVL